MLPVDRVVAGGPHSQTEPQSSLPPLPFSHRFLPMRPAPFSMSNFHWGIVLLYSRRTVLPLRLPQSFFGTSPTFTPLCRSGFSIFTRRRTGFTSFSVVVEGPPSFAKLVPEVSRSLLILFYSARISRRLTLRSPAEDSLPFQTTSSNFFPSHAS